MKKIKDFHFKIVGYDIDPISIKKAKENVKNANLQDFIEIKEQNFFESKKEHDKYLHLVFNPPYDERLSVKNIEEFYGNIGNTLKHGYPGSQAWMITSNMDALKCVGLRPSQKIKLFNGKLEAKLVKYEMYSGSKKASKQ